MSLKYTAPLSSGFPCFQKVSCHSYIFIPPYVMCQVFSLSAFYFSSSLLVFSNLIMLSFSVIFFMFLVLCDLLRFLNLWVSIFTFSKIHLKLFSHYFSNTFSIHSCFFPSSSRTSISCIWPFKIVPQLMNDLFFFFSLFFCFISDSSITVSSSSLNILSIVSDLFLISSSVFFFPNIVIFVSTGFWGNLANIFEHWDTVKFETSLALSRLTFKRF